MTNPSKCPKCASENIYQDGNIWTCPECNYEWSGFESDTKKESDSSPIEDSRIRDANGQVLNDGDTVTVLKELRVKGSNSAVKVGTKVKNIRLVDGGDGHDISCKIDGIGAINLKSAFVRKV